VGKNASLLERIITLSVRHCTDGEQLSRKTE